MRIYLITNHGVEATVKGSLLIIDYDRSNGVLAVYDRLYTGIFRGDRIAWLNEADDSFFRSLRRGCVLDDGSDKETRWSLVFDDGVNANLYDDPPDCHVDEAEREDRAEPHARGTANLDRLILELQAAQQDEVDEPDNFHGGSRGVVVLDRKLENIGCLLRDRNMIVIIETADDIDDAARKSLLPFRTLIVTDEQPFIDDASSYSYGIVSVRLLSKLEPKQLAKVISDAFARLALWTKRHGFLLLLRDDSEHEYRPLVD